MKRTLLTSVLALSLSWQSTALQAKATPSDWDYLQPTHNQVISSLNIVELLKRQHYNKPPLNDIQSTKVYNNYLKSLDPSRSFFTQADIDEFDAWSLRFDDFLKQGELEPGFTIYRRYLDRVESRIEAVLAQLNSDGVENMDFTVEETLEVDREKSPWAKNQAELDDLWRKRLKDEALRLKLAGKEPKAINELLIKRYNNQLSRLKQTRGEDVFQTYINAFAQSYDPHTQYLSPDNAENFDINMSLSLEGIGAMLQSDNEHVKIASLVPAGPAEKSKLLAPADKIVAVAQGNEEMVDVIGWRLDEVVKLIRGPKGSVVRLEIIPASNPPSDQSTRVVAITREAVKLEEQAAKKSVIDIEHDGKTYHMGVIEIPAFYLDFKALRSGDSNYKSTTRDVKKLITELKAENVDGIVFDLRNNGGGSLQEANELTGLFIPRGPTVQVRNSNGRVDVLTDDTSSVFYDGPMVVLVNRLSASASEIFAGAMQDYHRALIVGGQTFGKGTVQSIQPLNHGELKLTLAKFYRVSGQSTQHQGVLPDIAYPEALNIEQVGESALPEAMPWDSIRPAIRNVNNPYQPYLEQLRAQHEQRTAEDPSFIYQREWRVLGDELSQEKSISLNEATRKAKREEIEQRQLTLENNLRIAQGKDPLKKLKEEDEENSLPSEEDKLKPEDDAYLTESAHILLDYMQLRQPQVSSTR